ncbi:MAG: hypothetical protein MUC50_20690, partial [Myxococcota bacterium]|nr:hypothetical protein [Myxococcota bacterium]
SAKPGTWPLIAVTTCPKNCSTSTHSARLPSSRADHAQGPFYRVPRGAAHRARKPNDRCFPCSGF